MRIAGAIAALFGVEFAAIGIAGRHREADLAWQRWLGELILRTHHLPSALGAETFTAAGAPWLPQEWLFSLLVAVSHRVHAPWLLAGLIASGATLTLLCTALRARARGATTVGTWIAVFCTGVAMEQMFGVRAQIAAWPLFAVFLFLTERRDRWRFAAIPLTMLWANLHASVFIAPVFAAVAARTRDRLLLAAGCACATLATPFGWNLFLYAIRLTQSPIRAAILEWRPAHLTDPSVAFGLLPLALLALANVCRSRRRAFDDLPAVAFAVALGVQAVRDVPLAAIVLAPLAASAFDRLSALTDRCATLLERFSANAAALVLFTILSAAVAVRAEAAVRAAPSGLPAHEIARAAQLGERRLYCEDFAWCSLALAHRNLRTFLDGRCDPFPLRVWNAYLAIQRSPRQRDALLARYRVDTIIAHDDGSLALALRRAASWRVVESDRRFTLFVRAHARRGKGS